MIGDRGRRAPRASAPRTRRSDSRTCWGLSFNPGRVTTNKDSDNKAYFTRVRGGLEEAERLMRDEDPTVMTDRDAAWDNESLRADRKVDASSVTPPPPDA